MDDSTKQPEFVKPEELPQEKPADNLAMADQIMDSLFEPFSLALNRLSTKQLRRLIKILVKFPFADINKNTLKDADEKHAFMFGERLLYANMVKRARVELERTFDEIEKEKGEKNAETATHSEKVGV